jgi:dihydrofolate synthase/folylpolyglutamate synthase
MKTPAVDIQPDLDYLYALGGRGIKPGLERIHKLLTEIGNPHEHLKIIHVAGTNGKGSTCAIIASLLRAAGWRVGLYTSPHLLRFNERIRIDDAEISDAEISAFIRLWRPAIEQQECSFFEATTAMAFEYFHKMQVDYVVLETGMGGRFDATNVVRPEVTVITPVAGDHHEFLGRRLAQIAFEKAGIAKPGVPCIVARQITPVKNALIKEILIRGGQPIPAVEYCRLKDSRQFPDHQTTTLAVSGLTLKNLRFPLIGTHQLTNLQSSVTAFAHLPGLSMSEKIFRDGIAAVRWPGRLQILQNKPLVYYDVGHNQHGIRQAVRTLVNLFPDSKIHLLFALGDQKKYGRIGSIIQSLGGNISLSEIPGHPSIPCEKLSSTLQTVIEPSRITADKNLQKILASLTNHLGPEEILLIIGSHYLAPTVLPFFAGAHIPKN